MKSQTNEMRKDYIEAEVQKNEDFKEADEFIKSTKTTKSSNEFFIGGTDAEDLNANARATMTLKMTLAEGVVLLDQTQKNLVKIEDKQNETLADLYKKSNELQKLLESAAAKLGVDLKQPGWQFDPLTLRLFR